MLDCCYIEEFLVEFDDWTNTRLLRPSILSLKKQVRDLIVNETLNNIEEYYSNLVIIISFLELFNKGYPT